MGVGEHRASALSGYSMMFPYFGGFAGTGLHVYVMQGTGILAGTHEGRFFASIGVIRSYDVACTTTLGAKKTKLVREDLVDAGERYFVA
jgi:hypothetical protein